MDLSKAGVWGWTPANWDISWEERREVRLLTEEKFQESSQRSCIHPFSHTIPIQGMIWLKENLKASYECHDSCEELSLERTLHFKETIHSLLLEKAELQALRWQQIYLATDQKRKRENCMFLPWEKWWEEATSENGRLEIGSNNVVTIISRHSHLGSTCLAGKVQIWALWALLPNPICPPPTQLLDYVTVKLTNSAAGNLNILSAFTRGPSSLWLSNIDQIGLGRAEHWADQASSFS